MDIYPAEKILCNVESVLLWIKYLFAGRDIEFISWKISGRGIFFSSGYNKYQNHIKNHIKNLIKIKKAFSLNSENPWYYWSGRLDLNQ